jgi:hypothetical protein
MSHLKQQQQQQLGHTSCVHPTVLLVSPAALLIGGRCSTLLMGWCIMVAAPSWCSNVNGLWLVPVPLNCWCVQHDCLFLHPAVAAVLVDWSCMLHWVLLVCAMPCVHALCHALCAYVRVECQYCVWWKDSSEQYAGVTP